MKLRPYQQDCIDALFKHWKTNDRALAVLACGAGKTFIFASMVKKILDAKPGFRCLFVADSNVLITQTAKAMGVEYGIYNAALKEKDLSKAITICSIQSIVNAPSSTFDLIVFDEVHESALDNETSRARRLYEKYGCKVLGLTATPFDRKGFIYGEDKFFSNVTYEKDMESLTNEGYLSPVTLSEPSACKYNTDNLKLRGGDFITKDLINLVTKDKSLTSRVKDVLERTRHRKKVVIICVSIEHANDVASCIMSLGHDCGTLHSKSKTNEYDKDQFENYDLKYLTSVMMLKKGYDYPALDCIALFRPVRSPALYVQIVGRLARLLAGKKDGLFLDYGGCVDALGSHYAPLIRGCVPSRLELCPECSIFQPLGTEVCECGFVLKIFPPNQTTKERNLFKNLTSEAHQEWHKISRIIASDHKAKSGNDCVKVTFKRGMFDNYFVNEYFNKNNIWAAKSFLNINFGINETPVDNEDMIRLVNESQGPKEILVTKVNGFNKIIGRRL